LHYDKICITPFVAIRNLHERNSLKFYRCIQLLQKKTENWYGL